MLIYFGRVVFDDVIKLRMLRDHPRLSRWARNSMCPCTRIREGKLGLGGCSTCNLSTQVADLSLEFQTSLGNTVSQF